MAAVSIRPFRPEDARALAALFHTSVREVGGRDYSPEQTAAWSPSPPDPARYLRLAAERTILVAVDAGGGPAGYIELGADGHIDHFYVRPDRAGSGVGSALLAALERCACEQGIRALHVEASEAARRLLLRRGFAELSRNDLVRRGVAIHNFNMRKRLDSAGS